MSKLLSPKEALRYLHHHGETLQSSRLRDLSSQGVLKCLTTSGGHRRYSIENLQDYLRTLNVKAYWIKEAAHLPSFVAPAASLERHKAKSFEEISLSSSSPFLAVCEIIELIRQASDARHLIMGSPSQETMQVVPSLLAATAELGFSISFEAHQ